MTSTGHYFFVLIFVLVSVLGFAGEALAVMYSNGQVVEAPNFYIGPTGTYKEDEDVVIWNDCGGSSFAGWSVGYYLDKTPQAFNKTGAIGSNDGVIFNASPSNGYWPSYCAWGGEETRLGKLSVGWHMLYFVFFAIHGGEPGDVGRVGGSGSTYDLAGYFPRSFEVCVANVFEGCESAPNSCGDKNPGIISCDGRCVNWETNSAVAKPEERPWNAWDSSCTYTPSSECVSNINQSCESAANSCGDRAQGHINCSGTCADDWTGLPITYATTPAERPGWDEPCNSPANLCGQKISGTIGCDGLCSAGYTPIPETTPTGATFGDVCGGTSENICGGTASAYGLIQCNGYCSVSIPPPPPLPDYYNTPCNSLANNCGQTTPSTKDCYGFCRVYEPPPETTLTGATYGASCSQNLCGLQYDGAIGCSGVCDVSPTPSGAAAPAAETPAPPQATITSPGVDKTIVLNGTSISYSGSGTADTSLGTNSITAYEWRDGSCTTGSLLSTAASFSTVLSTGTHRVYLRVKDSNGTWSTNCPSAMTTEQNPQPPIVRLLEWSEYYPDSLAHWSASRTLQTTPDGTSYGLAGIGYADPDTGLGWHGITAYEWRDGSCTAGSLISTSASFSQVLSTGTHRIYLRARDSYGTWSTNCPSVKVTEGTLPYTPWAEPTGTPQLTVSQTSVPYGGQVEVSWYYSGSGCYSDTDAFITGGYSSSKGLPQLSRPLFQNTTFSYHCTSYSNITGGYVYANSAPITVTVSVPAPTASLSVSQSVPYGGQAEILWSSSNATSGCTAGGPWSTNNASSGRGLSSPLTTNTTFTLQCTGRGGQTTSVQSATVSVTTPPVSASYTVSPLSGFVGDLFNWKVWNVRGGTGFGSYAYSWSGGPSATGNPNNLSGTGKTVTKSYTVAGDKTGTVTVTSGSASRAFTCPISVAARPDLTATAPTITLSTNSSNRIIGAVSTTIQNIDAGSTNAGFTNLFQKADTYNSSTDVATNVQDIGASQISTALAGNTTATTSFSYTFPTADTNTTRYIRVCADKNLSGATTITESNENNNCGAWTSVFVYPALTATCTVSAAPPPPPPLTGYYTTQTFTYTLSNVAGGNGTYTYSPWSGTDGLTGSAPTSDPKKYTSGGQKAAAITVTSAGFTKTATCSVDVQPIADLIVTPP